ncbi:MAG: hypothetical protein PWQ55_443 [Chloroflexota bacterium]|nr:hypothetical protein [Chloroflexota bacterium]
MSTEKSFPILLLIARPAAGKSEVIHYLNNLPEKERSDHYHVGTLKSIDDFPFLWRWFEEDELLEKMGHARLYTDSQGYFKENYLWDLLIRLINLDYQKYRSREDQSVAETTVLLEFSRGKEHGGYRHALPILSDEILEDLSIIYINVPWEESLRKNRSRFNPKEPDSILQHSLPDEKLERLYKDCDFMEMVDAPAGTVSIRDHQVPYVVFENADDVTTGMGAALGERLQECLQKLWDLRSA